MPAEEFPCKVEGCTETSTVRKGMYAYRCAAHRKQLAAEHPRKKNSRRGTDAVVRRSYTAQTQRSLAAEVNELAGIAARIDENNKVFQQSKASLRNDVVRFSNQIDRLKDTLKEILNG